MKAFYLSAFAVVFVLVLSPLFFLADAFKEHNPKGSVYRAAFMSAVKSVDPATCGDMASSSLQENFYEGLYTYHYLKRPVVVIPQLAKSFPTVSEDGLTYTIPIRSDILFHRNLCFGHDKDGRQATRKVTAKDFILSFKRIADYHINTGLAWAFISKRIKGLDTYRQQSRYFKSGDFSRYQLPVSGLRAPNDSTLVIELTEPYPQFIYVLAMHVYAPVATEAVQYWLTQMSDEKGNRIPIPEHIRNPEFKKQEHVVGTGPYILKTWKRKWKFILTRNPDFRTVLYPNSGEPASDTYPGDSAMGLLKDANKPIPFIDEIHLRFVEENYPYWMMFLSNLTDKAGILTETYESVMTPDKDLKPEWKQKGIFLRRISEPTIFWLAFNMEDPVFKSSPSLRRGLSLGFDVETYIQIISNGRGRRAVNIIPSLIKGHKEAGPGPYYRYAPEEAKRYIDSAKKELAAANLLVNGKIPTFKVDLSQGAIANRQADFIQQQFSAIGLEFKVVFNDWPTLLRKINNKQFQIYSGGWGADYPDAENFLQLFYSGNIDKGTNHSNYQNPVYDSLYLMIRKMPDNEERTALYARMANIISHDCPILLTSERELFSMYYPNVKNVKQHPILQGYVKYYRKSTDQTGNRKKL